MSSLFTLLRPLSKRARLGIGIISFVLPLLLWSLVSYVPFIWHPMVKVTSPGAVSWFKEGMLLDKADFSRERDRVASVSGELPSGIPANPIFLPAPHQVGVALYTAFTTPPVLKGDRWLHESLWQSVQTIFWGFLISTVIGLPLGIYCGAYAAVARLSEPVIDFVRYMPAPAFGALMVAILGIHLEPKIAIIVIGTFFQQVLVIANTVRKVDPALVEAAQTLGAKPRQLVWKVFVPACLPDLYNDLRILLGWAWTYLIVAEVVGVSSGITFFINQQAKYRNFPNVYAAIIIIGILGLVGDLILGFVGERLFAWKTLRPSRTRRFIQSLLGNRRLVFTGEIPKDA